MVEDDSTKFVDNSGDKWGAEAVLTKTEWSGYKAIKKIRLPKKYRIEPLDKELRKSRTLIESKLLIAAKRYGIHTPYIFDLDIPNTTIVMEDIEGSLVKDILDSDIDLKEKLTVSRKIGYQVGILHNNEIIHGDLTTSNVIEDKGEVIFIDFGLGKFSKAVEDKAVDILLMKKCFISTHTANSKELFFAFQEGYRESLSNSKSVFKRAIKVEARGRHLKEEQLMSDFSERFPNG